MMLFPSIAAILLLASPIQSARPSAFRTLFATFDLDRNGCVEAPELELALQAEGVAEIASGLLDLVIADAIISKGRTHHRASGSSRPPHRYLDEAKIDTTCHDCHLGCDNGHTDCTRAFENTCDGFSTAEGILTGLLLFAAVAAVAVCMYRSFVGYEQEVEHRADVQLTIIKRQKSDLADLENAWIIEASAITWKKKIAEGSYGEVWDCMLNDQYHVAVKKIFNSTNTDLSSDTELHFLQRTRHRNLVMMFGCGRCEDKCIMIVLEFMPDGDLSTLLWEQVATSPDDADYLKDGKVPDASKSGAPSAASKSAIAVKVRKVVGWEQKLALMLDVAEGMAYLHDVANSLHRDLKSPNILLTTAKKGRQHGNLIAKVADFGLARIVENSQDTTEAKVPCSRPATVTLLTPMRQKPSSADEKPPTSKNVDIFDASGSPRMEQTGETMAGPTPVVADDAVASNSSGTARHRSLPHLKIKLSKTFSKVFNRVASGMSSPRSRRSLDDTLVAQSRKRMSLRPDTRMTSACGTTLWMAPELCASAAEHLVSTTYSQAVDTFSYGIILWEFLEHRRPWLGELRWGSKIQAAVISGRRPSVSPEKLAAAPQFYEELLNKCWAAEPHDRPPFSAVVAKLVPELARFS